MPHPRDLRRRALERMALREWTPYSSFGYRSQMNLSCQAIPIKCRLNEVRCRALAKRVKKAEARLTFLAMAAQTGC